MDNIKPIVCFMAFPFLQRSSVQTDIISTQGPESWRRPEGRFFEIPTPTRPRGRRKRFPYPKRWGKSHLSRMPSPSAWLLGSSGLLCTLQPASLHTDCRKGGGRKPEEVHHE